MRASAPACPGLLQASRSTARSLVGGRRARARRAGARFGRDAVPDRVDLEAVHGDARSAVPRARRRAVRAPAPHCRSSLRVCGAAPERLPRPLVVLERRLLRRWARAQRRRRVVLLGCDALALLEPLGLEATGYDEPAGVARGHVQEARPVSAPLSRTRIPSRGGRQEASGRRSPIFVRAFGGTGSTPNRVRARAAARRARGAVLRSAVGCATSRGRLAARPRGIRGRIPVASADRAGGEDGASRAHEQLARERR